MIYNILEGTTTNYTMYIVLGAMLVLMIGYMIFSSIRRKKQVEEDQSKRDALGPGSKIMTAGGILGIIESIEGDELVINSEGTKFRIDKRAIYQIISSVARANEVNEDPFGEEKDPFEKTENDVDKSIEETSNDEENK